MKKMLDKLITVLLRLAASALMSAFTAPILIEAATRERHYFAIGGEWLLIIAIAAGAWVLSGYIIKGITKKEPWEKQGENKNLNFRRKTR